VLNGGGLPARDGGIAAIELGAAIHRVALDVDPRDWRRIVLAAPALRATPARTTGTSRTSPRRRSAHLRLRERIRDTAAAMRGALEKGDWDEVGYQIAKEWDNRKRLAPGVTTSGIDDLIERAAAAGATAAKVCGAGGGGCLFVYADPSRRAAVREAIAEGGGRVLDYRIERDGLRLTGDRRHA
jgi:D-glycero-alpha-D-manno-heptose-7-phosphate kinase